ncbi:ferritin [Candidatus Parcubacteria bacterium]|nr:ferritin [Patescibacteria group bacterium]MBU4309692.1 ferritin [Patescibacteria group bacterium]MBU4431684.1 ferritin [Patescibacteria group bacterium]MBU4577920.1 ferritin [Patescibacteria group bacterium]MCG2696570.1 ferritin [Candidatus Parcubacteria bacterium]
MKIFTCRICGEVYLGEEVPHTCPFCGVSRRYLWLSKIWKDEGKDLVLSDASRSNLEKALKIELSNTAFYLAAAQNLSNQEIALMFKGLAKVENEHAGVFRKLLKAKIENDPSVVENCADDATGAVKESAAREQRAVEFYGQAMGEASEPWVKEVFKAIMETEADHLKLDNNYLKLKI